MSLQAELDALRVARADVADIVEGEQDILRENVQSTTITTTSPALNFARERLNHLDRAINEIEQLVAHGHPLIPPIDAEQAVLDDIDEQLRTLTRARALFRLQPATQVQATFGPIERKPEP